MWCHPLPIYCTMETLVKTNNSHKNCRKFTACISRDVTRTGTKGGTAHKFNSEIDDYGTT